MFKICPRIVYAFMAVAHFAACLEFDHGMIYLLLTAGYITLAIGRH